jgi:hypothetical protein
VEGTEGGRAALRVLRMDGKRKAKTGKGNSVVGDNNRKWGFTEKYCVRGARDQRAVGKREIQWSMVVSSSTIQ